MNYKTLFLLLRQDTGKVRGMFGGMVKFRVRGMVNSVIIDVITRLYKNMHKWIVSSD